MTRTKTDPRSSCKWEADEDGIYHTDCGHEFTFIDDGPIENKQQFCGYCGKRLKAKAVKHSRSEFCGDCDGCGWVEGGAVLQTTCRTCNGTGQVQRSAGQEEQS